MPISAVDWSKLHLLKPALSRAEFEREYLPNFDGWRDTPATWAAIESARQNAENEARARGDSFYFFPAYAPRR